jgi:exonuclease III
MAKFLRIAQWNANGLAQHKDEVQLFLQQNKIDILLVSETHFTMKIHFRVPQYNTYYTNHPYCTANAGTDILVKHNSALRIIAICTWPPPSHIHLCSSTPLRDDSFCGVLPPLPNIISKRSNMKLSSAPWAQDSRRVEISIVSTQLGDLELLQLKVESCFVSCNNKITHSNRLAALHIGPRIPPSDLIS